MKPRTQKVSYSSYKKRVISKLSQVKTWAGNGVFKRQGCYYKPYILPLEGENNPRNRAKAIEKYLGFDCSTYFPTGLGLHQYAHHLNSSQTLCLMFFSRLIEEKQITNFIKNAFGIEMHEGAEVHFEYRQDSPISDKESRYQFIINGNVEYEGTSFDFHIQDGHTEIFFEIKFTEDGFGKATNDARHKCKAKQYQNLLPEDIRIKTTQDDILKFYQLFRNIIRVDQKNKYVIFITDANNPSTNRDICKFKKLIDCDLSPMHIQFKTWQELSEIYRAFAELPLQFNAILTQQ